MKGYAGQILHVDLTEKQCWVEKPEEGFYRAYLGGSCLGTYYVLKETPKNCDPLGPENVIVFSVGPVTGASLSGAARHAVTAKSPLTGSIGASEAGGYWAPELKKAGFDAVVIKGRASSPQYLWIHNGEYELRDASALWGKTTGDVQQLIREELNDKNIRVAQIGPSGENGCLYANIVNELAHFNGRGGLGAVMGSKNLRAIAVRGMMKPDFADAEGLMALAKRGAQQVLNEPGPAGFKQEGTNNCVNAHIGLGGLPTRNWSSGVFEGQDELTPKAWESVIKPGTCFACVQSCKRHVDPKKVAPDVLDPKYGGPEYETVGMCGSNLCISDKIAICKINEIAAKYAFDTISFGVTVGFLMECMEKGLITPADTGGIELRFGDADAVIRLAELTGKGEGFGREVALGSARLAKKIGKGSEKLLATVKNREFPAHMPQAKASLALAYALTPFGADHVTIEMDPAIGALPLSDQMRGFGFDRAEDPYELNLEKSKLFWRTQLMYSMMDAACMCLLAWGMWTIYTPDDLVDAVNMATGWKTNLYEMLMAGERRLQMMRAYNIREGLTNADDELPGKMFAPLKGGITDGFTVDKEMFYQAREFFYEMAGWTGENGAPTKARLLSLNLDWLAE